VALNKLKPPLFAPPPPSSPPPPLLQILLSTELEYRRQLEQLDFTDDWLERQRAELEQAEFLQAWKLHTEMVSKMCQQVSKETGVLDSLSANLRVKGEVSICNEDGAPLMSESGGKPFTPSSTGTTELRQQLFADANAGATTVTGNTKKSLVSPGAADMINSAVKLNNGAGGIGGYMAPQTSGMGGVQYVLGGRGGGGGVCERRERTRAWWGA
jgi:hypothetical protein